MSKKISLLKILIFMMIVLGLMMAGATAKSFAADAPNARATISDPDGVNIRSSYSTASSIVGAIPANTTVTVLSEKFVSTTSTAKTNVWYKITSSYGDGYIRSDLASISYSSAKGKTTDGVNYRTGPGTGFTVKGTLSNGTSVTVVCDVINADGEKWNKISYNGGYYYIFAEYIALTESGGGGDSSGNISDADFEKMIADFPDSYKTKLRALHKQHPNWKFRAKELPFTWQQALDEQCANVNANLVGSEFPESYKAVQSGTYDFINHLYKGKDGMNWVAASRQAVAYYMDPRNWLTEDYIFMFEPHTYDGTYQTQSLVSSILSGTALPKLNSNSAAYYVEAGKKYNISPVYLASKTRVELGSSDYMVRGQKVTSTYDGKTYPSYNPYNIGASDSASGNAAYKGLVWAVSGKTYGRPWNTLQKGIAGGADCIAEDFVGDNQYTSYTERYNVYNGLSSIGTHQYMTSIYAPKTEASVTQNTFSGFGVLDKAFTFEIPVYKSMPSSAAAKPGAGNNNNYLDSLKVYDGTIQKTLDKTFSRFTTTYKAKVAIPYSSTKVTVKTETNVSDAKVSVSGNTNLKVGENKITVKVTSSTGLVRNYYVTVVRSQSSDQDNAIANGVKNTTVNASIVRGTKSIDLSWKKSDGYKVDGYEIYRGTTSSSQTSYGSTTKTTYQDLTLTPGVRYYYKIRGYRTIDGQKVYTKWSNVVNALTPEAIGTELKNGVKNTTVSISSYATTSAITVSWEKSNGYKVDGYELYRSAGNDDNFVLYTTTTGTSFENSASLVSGKRYYYKVRGYRTIAGEKVYTKWSGTTYRLGKQDENAYLADGVKTTTVTASAAADYNSIKLSWEKAAGFKVDGYEIYRGTSSSNLKYYDKKNGTTYQNYGIDYGSTYYYRVRGYRTINGTKVYTKWSNMVNKEAPVGAADKLKDGVRETTISISSHAAQSAITVSWEKSNGYKVDGYELYRSAGNDDNFTLYTTTTGTSFKNSASLVLGERYYYKVRGYRTIAGEKVYTKWSDTTCRFGKLDENAYQLINGVENTAVTGSITVLDGSIKLSWQKENGYKVDGYEIYRGTTSSNLKYYDKKNGTTYQNYSVNAGTRYYYRVRGYRTIDGVKVYTQWSNRLSAIAK